MISENIALYNWSNGVIMMVVFGLACVALIVTLLIFMSGGKKEETKEE